MAFNRHFKLTITFFFYKDFEPPNCLLLITIVLNQEFESVLHGHHTPVMLWGAPGIGKSQIISQIATEHNVDMIDI
jgi:hypothetical protein